MQVVTHLNPTVWKAFVDENPCGNIFHTPEMFEVFRRAKGHRPSLWAVVGDGGEVLALLPLVDITLIDGPLQSLTTRAIAYGSILTCPGDQGAKALRLLLETYKRRAGARALFTEFRNISDLTDQQQALKDCGFVFEDHLNFVHDLTVPLDSIWRNIDRRKRSKIRACQSKELVVEDITEADRLEVAYRFLEDVYNRVQVPLADISLFKAAFDVLWPKGMFRVLLARVGDRYAATSFALCYHGRILWWYIGSDRSMGHIGASESLVWHMMEWGKANGYEIFDFGGGGKPDEEYEPRQFKRQFGGVQVNYGRQVCVHSPMRLSISKAGYEFYRRFANGRIKTAPKTGEIDAPLHDSSQHLPL